VVVGVAVVGVVVAVVGGVVAMSDVHPNGCSVE